ncbi:MAG: SAM-dependent methyltransferase [Bryobacteraceae bacterium]
MFEKHEPASSRRDEDSTEVRLPRAVPEGRGVYNNHSKVRAAGAALATRLLEKAVQNVAFEREDGPVVIADYGSSEGKNSLGPMRTAIRSVRERVGPLRPIVVVHIDQPSNDFNALFDVLSSDSNRYVLDEANVFPCAIGRSFYEQVLPPDSVHVAWSSYAAVWLRRVPSTIPGHIFSLCSTGAIRSAFERQAAEDWEAFLSLRAREMCTGARLVVVLPSFADDQLSGFQAFMDHANAVLGEMVDEGAITSEERAGMVLGCYPRQKDELLAPFGKGGRFQNLTVEDCEISVLPDPIWANHKEEGNTEALARKYALRFRAIFMPSLTSALTRVRAGDGAALRSFADRLEDGLTRRLRRDPVRTDSLVQTIVLAKGASCSHQRSS